MNGIGRKSNWHWLELRNFVLIFEIKRHEELLSVHYLEESVACWIIQPWIVIWASYTCLEINKLSGNFFSGQSARCGHPASGFAILIDWTLLPPWFKVLYFAGCFWILHPLNYLCHCHKINVVMIWEDFIDPVKESVEELRVIFQPSSVEVKTEWGAVCVVVTLKVMVKESVKLITLK